MLRMELTEQMLSRLAFSGSAKDSTPDAHKLASCIQKLTDAHKGCVNSGFTQRLASYLIMLPPEEDRK